MRRERYTIKHYKTKFKIYYKIRLIKANEYNIYIYIQGYIYILFKILWCGGGGRENDRLGKKLKKRYDFKGTYKVSM